MSECHVPPTLPPEPPSEPPAAPPGTPASRLVATLGVAGAVAGLLIVMAFQWAKPRIDAHAALVLATAVDEVLAAPARTERLFLHDGRLVPELPAGVDSMKVERLFVGYDEAGGRVGFAVRGGEPGFQDVITVIFGYDAEEKRVLGMKVLDNKETPGLGDKIVKDSTFVGAFRGAAAPLQGVKAGTGSGTENEVDMITGATISSRAVIQIINHRIEAVSPVIEAYLQETSR